MAAGDKTHEWWVRTLLGQQRSAHPVFGCDVHVQVDGAVVTLRGRVESLKEALELEHEARAVPSVREVINQLTVVETGEEIHLQTVIAVFPDAESAQLACRTAAEWTFHREGPPTMLQSVDETVRLLRERAEAAQVPDKTVHPFVEAVERGKVLLVDRVPEDDALRVISELEGSAAQTVQTLPPEPNSKEQ